MNILFIENLCNFCKMKKHVLCYRYIKYFIVIEETLKIRSAKIWKICLLNK